MEIAGTTQRRAVLQFRACLVVLCLYYCEYIKSTILETLEDAHPRSGGKSKGAYGIHEALNRLVVDGVLSPSEKEEVRTLVQYRNDIAHRIHEIVGGLGVASGPGQFGFTATLDPRDKNYLERLRFYADQIVERLELNYRVPFSSSPFLFEETRDAYEGELQRLASEIENL